MNFLCVFSKVVFVLFGFLYTHTVLSVHRNQIDLQFDWSFLINFYFASLLVCVTFFSSFVCFLTRHFLSCPSTSFRFVLRFCSFTQSDCVCCIRNPLSQVFACRSLRVLDHSLSKLLPFCLCFLFPIQFSSSSFLFESFSPLLTLTVAATCFNSSTWCSDMFSSFCSNGYQYASSQWGIHIIHRRLFQCAPAFVFFCKVSNEFVSTNAVVFDSFPVFSSFVSLFFVCVCVSIICSFMIQFWLMSLRVSLTACLLLNGIEFIHKECW